MRYRNETCGWHVCAGRVKHVVDLDLMTAAPAGRPTLPEDLTSESTPPKES